MNICGGSSFHPYECSHDKYCIHCTWGVTEYHQPKECALCQDLGFRVVKEPYAIRIIIRNVSHRKRKVQVLTPIKIKALIGARQQTLPF